MAEFRYWWRLSLQGLVSEASPGLVYLVTGRHGESLSWEDFLACCDPSELIEIDSLWNAWTTGKFSKQGDLHLRGHATNWLVLLQGAPRLGDPDHVEISLRLKPEDDGEAEVESALLSPVNLQSISEVVLQQSGHGTWCLNLTNGTLVWNETTFRLHGISQDYIPDLEASLLYYEPDSRELFKELLKESTVSGQAFSCLVKLTPSGPPDGDGQVLRFNIFAHPNSDQQAQILVGTCQLVPTSEHPVRQGLPSATGRGSEAEPHLEIGQEVIDTMQEVCLVLDGHGFVIQALIPPNSSWAVNSSTLVGSRLVDSVTSSRELFKSEISMVWQLEKNSSFEYSETRPQGKEYRYQVRLQVARGAGNASKRLVIWVREITEQHDMLLDLQRSRQEALQASVVKSQFLANMSHEIRTPLNGVIGMTELALLTNLTSEQRDYLDTALGSARNLLEIINDILDISKIEAGRLQLESIPFNIRSTIKEAATTVYLKNNDKPLELLISVHPEVSQLVVGDPLRFRQLLLNLLGNALKFTEQGEVELEVARRGPEILRVSVYDTGPGIAPGRQSSIFEAFTQADGATTRQFGGTGLGLTICKQLVELMGGTIWLDSQVGKGSQFSFTSKVPNYQSDSDFSPLANLARDLGIAKQLLVERNGERLLGLRALIVDDNSSSRRVIRDMLARWGLEPTTVIGPGPALQHIREKERHRASFDLAILDQNMPGCSGLELAAELEPQLTKVLLTSEAMSPSELEAANVQLTLAKPVWASELATLLLERFGSAKAQTPIENTETAGQGPISLKILLAEDNAINAKVMLRLLSSLNHEVVHVLNGQLALEVLQQQSFDLVLMDIQMPVMDGFEATRRIRKLETVNSTHVPIVALTANAMAGDREKCLESGMDNYLTKPLERAKLIEVLGDLAQAVGLSRALAVGD